MSAHRAFIILSLSLAAVAGTSLGVWMMLGWLGWVSVANFPLVLSAHAQLQVYGFVTLFTMGVAMMVLPTFLQTTLKPQWLAALCLALMVTGMGVNLNGPTRVGAALQTLAVICFLAVIRATRRSAPLKKQAKSPLKTGHAVFLATGALWLMASPSLAFLDSTQALETVLWGFAGLYIAGIGLRVHPGILGTKGLHANLLLPSAAFWNLALLLRWVIPGSTIWVWSLALGVGTFLMALRPFRRSTLPPAGGAWLRVFVRASYLWLMVAVGMALLTSLGHGQFAGPGRHALASGFILTMMMGMGLRMIPAFECRRLVWLNGPWLVFVAITVGGILRVGGQAVGRLQVMGVGGALQAFATLSFVMLLVGTMLVGKKLQCEPKNQAPAFLLDQKAAS